MEPANNPRARARIRDDALRLLERLTVGSTIAALAGVGVFAVVSAQTIPGSAAASTNSASASTSSGSQSNSSNSSSGIQSSTGVNSSSGAAVAVTGGSR